MNDRRRQIIESFLGKTVQVVVDRPIGYVHGSIVYPVNYGYVSGVLAGDDEEQDAYILGVDKPLDSFTGRVVGAVCRKNDCEDKLAVAPEGVLFHQGQIAEAVHFQEQYFDTYIISLLRKSCGVLPYRETDRGKEFLMVFEQFSQCWSLPKGHMEAGETERQTALRELYEETGLTAQLDTEKSAVIEYAISPTVCKKVVFFLGQVSGTPHVREGEIESYRWVTADKLAEYLHADTADACMQLLNA